MSIAPYIVLISLAAVGVVEAVAYLAIKGDRGLNSRRAIPE